MLLEFANHEAGGSTTYMLIDWQQFVCLFATIEL